MRRRHLLIFLLLVSCTAKMQETTPVPSKKDVVISASLPPEIKTVLRGLQCKWTEEDKIAVNGKTSASVQLSSDSLTARFAVKDVSLPYRCISPASALVAGKAIVPSTQKYVKGSFDPAASILLARSQSESVIFRHAMAYIRLNVKAGEKDEAIKSISISAVALEDMSGSFTIDEDYLSIGNDAKTGKGIFIDCGSGAALESDIIIAIPPKNYSKGFTITVRSVAGHYQTVTSTDAFLAQAGKIYPTSFTFVPQGTLIDGNLPPMPESQVSITDFSELNAGADETDSHSSDYARSYISLDKSSVVALGPAQGLDAPNYPRIRKMPDGSYLLLWHQSDTDDDTNGMDVYYASSPDLKNWENKGKLFPRVKNTYTPDGNATKVYTNGNALVLPNGIVCAVASFRPFSTYGKSGSQMYSGIELKRSADSGKTWTTVGKVIHRGPNWEAHLLRLKNGRLQCYFSESHPLISGGNSGTAMVYSDDDGASWLPELGSSPWSDYSPIHAIRHNWPSNSAYPERYTDQMPVLIQLNSGQQIVGVFETVDTYNSSTGSIKWKISQSRSPENGEWADLADGPDGTRGNGGEVYTYSSDYYNAKVAAGAAPYIIQFPSGETVVAYRRGSDGHQCAMIGDAAARNFSREMDLFKETGFWGGLEVSGTHEMIAAVRLSRGGDKSASNPPVIGIARYFLNHSITPARRSVMVDGRNGEWARTDDALFVGAGSAVGTTLRSSVDKDNLYFLVEVKDSQLSDADYACIYLSSEASSLGLSARRIKVNKTGLVSSEKYQSGAWKTDSSLGIQASASCLTGQGYIVEVSVPRSSAPSGDTILVDLAHYGQGLSAEERIAGQSPSTWLYLKNINI